jgi:hypothetical protein
LSGGSRKLVDHTWTNFRSPPAKGASEGSPKMRRYIRRFFRNPGLRRPLAPAPSRPLPLLFAPEPPAPLAGIIRPVQRAYLASTRLLGAALLLVGVAMVASTIARGGGALAVGVLLGIMLAVVGAARLWLARGGER